MMTKLNYFKTFLATMLLLLGSNYAGAVTNWATFAANNAATPAAGDYYLYNANANRKMFATIKVSRSSTGAVNLVDVAGSADVNQAALFTLSGTFLAAVKFQLTEQIDGETYYLNGTGTSFSKSSATRILESESGKKYYYIRNTQSPTNYYLYLSSSGGGMTGVKGNTGTNWYFIPAASIHNGVSVTGLNANGSMTIDTPTGSATGEVKFNVSGDGPASAFNIELTGGDGHFVMGTATRSGNVITVPVTYTAQNRHSGTSTPASTATVTITAKNTGATTASGTVSAYVDLEPRFALTVSSLDWSHTGLDGEEIFYKGQEIAASQRDRLANKLVYNDAQTTGTAKSNATWTATIQGTNADQFKFANGTQTVSAKYNASLLDVIYAPTTTGTHNATLHIVTSYKDASNHTETVEHDIALSGKGSADARIAFAKAGNQLPTNAESHNFGSIIGTNQQDITANLYIYQITNPQMTWDDGDGQFVFVNQSSVDLSQQVQTLTFRAKRTSPVEVSAVQTASLTVSGKGPANEDVSATITLTYTAVPLTPTSVTWNWATIREGLTAYNPITTNSDGAWTLTKTAGDKLTYDPATKSATAEYTHHEPGNTAAFILSIPQTDTYAAFDAEYETSIVSSVQTIELTTTAQFDDPSVMTHKILSGPFGDTHYAEFEPTQNKLTIYDDAWVEFMTAGQNTISFHYDEDDDEIWTVTEYYDNNTSKVIYQDVTLTSGTDVTWNFSPNATKIRIEETGEAWGDNGYFTNVKIYEYEALAASEEIIALMDNSGTVSSRNVTLTMANKRQVTATLNETAAQYFTIAEAAAAAPAAPTAPEILLTTAAQFDDESIMTYKDKGSYFAGAEFDESAHKLSISGWVDFFTAGQSKISFYYEDAESWFGTPNPIWTVTEYVGDAANVIYENVDLTSGTDVTWSFSPNATKIRIEDQNGDGGVFTNVRLYGEAPAVAPAAPEILLTTAAQFDDESIMTYKDKGSYFAGAEFDESAHKLSISGWVDFFTAGQSKISFYYEDAESWFGTPNPIWTVTEYVGDAANVIYENVDLTSGTDVTWSFSPNATKIRIEDQNGDGGDFTNVRLYTEAPASAAGGEPVSSMVFGDEDGLGFGKVVEKVITVALKEGANVAEAKAASAGNACQLIIEDDYIYDHEVLTLPIAIVGPCDITYKHSANGTYQIAYPGDVRTISSSDYNKHITETDPAKYIVTLSAPTPASGYQFQGWKINDATVSCKESFTTSVSVTGSVVEAAFVAVEAQNFKVGDVYFEDLGVAATAAGTSADSKIVTLMRDLTLGDGTTSITYTIPAGVTLLIPHKADFFERQETPEIISPQSNAEVLAAYRTLTLKEGVTINCSGNICVAGKMLSTGGGNKSAYTTGECGVINMANGGHIELNNGAHLFCWGYIKGQDMDQGNNTVGTGTVTANNGATIWENFELGDWRGGTASFDIYNNNVVDHRKLFPFQSYAIQNIEIPTSFMHGSTLRTFTSITTGFGHHDAVFSMVGPENTMFLLTDEESVVRTWYDATTDLTCYELSGTAKLDALHVTVYVDMSSENFILPISNSMHIILKDCNMNLANPLMVQAGAIVEIKPSATVNLTSELYLYDVDQWGKYVHDYYFRSFNNLTSHKNRGAENSKAGLDDAKLIVDGIFNVQNGGKLYTTAGGANVMGNGGGQISFKSALPADNILWAVTVLSGAPYINWEYNDVKAANLCNEDGSYTRSIGSNNTFYNINGRWFHSEDKDAQEDHTYFFTYMENGNSGEDVTTDAVYSHDKTGLEERMKWFNVSADANCANWWTGTNPAASYNYTMLNDWHQFMPTEEAGVYSGSNNALYQKDECDLIEAGVVDENCLYTFEDGKKALVDGEFIPLTSNGYDPAYHQTDDASKYFICFTGCNWHPATPYTGESKAYTIHPEDVDLHYIWFNNDWLNVLRDEPFFYTEDEQTNVRTYYEYVNGEWEIATPYVSVSDEAETRTFYMIKEAFNVAQIKKNATITLLRDLPNVPEKLTYETQNTTCTLDLNGHLLAGNIANLITINAPGATFTITDNSDLKIGKISNAANKAVYVTKGTLVVANGTIESTGANAIDGASSATITINGGYFAANTKCVNGTGCSISGGHFNKNAGLATYAAAHKYPFETADPKYKYEVSDAWTITFKDGTTTLQTLHLKPGETPVYTAAQPTKDGYKFVGWNTSIVPATADATYTAQFEEVAAGSKCVTLNSNGGNEGLQYIYVTSGSAVGTLPQTTKEGNTFAGWFTQATGGTQVNASTTVSADVTWYAHYTKNSYTLTWDANGGELSGDYTQGSVQYGATITKPTATFEGHTFLGWNVTPAATMPAANTTYTAQWSIAAKHYLQNLDGTYPATPEATENVTGGAGEYVTPAVKTYDGFISPNAQTVQIGAVNEVTYQYERREYTITLNATANGGECATASINVKHGATPSLPVASKDGYSFAGWFTKAVGGDEITKSTTIQRNIGTLYAQFLDANLDVTTELTIEDARRVNDLRITTTGSLTITGSVQAKNFILESNGSTASGQFLAGYDKLTFEHAYFDLQLNAKNHLWYGVAVPWPVDATSGISVNGRTLQLGKDFDIIYYDGARRADEGKQKCWSYVQNDGDKTLVPGRLYMIGLMGDAAVVRFEKKALTVLSTTTTSVAAHPENTGDATDRGWNGVANPALFHAFVNPGVTEGQVFVPNESRYEPISLNTAKFVVGQGAFVQVEDEKLITVNQNATSFAAPRRAKAQTTSTFDVRIAPAEADYTDRLFIKTTDSRENRYTIGQDLAKVGVSSKVAQMWVNRYDAKLCVNTAELINETADYPLGISVPAAGDYTITNNQSPITNDQYELYLTLNGEVIWNLSEGAFVLSLEKGTTNAYGLRLNTNKMPTAIDEAVVDAQGQTRKVLINNQIFILRGDKVYSIDGQMVK